MMSEKEFFDKLDAKILEMDRKAKRIRNIMITIISVMAIGILSLGAANIASISQNSMRSKANEQRLKSSVTVYEFGLVNELHELQNQIITAKIQGDDQAFIDLMKEFYNVRRAIISNMNITRGLPKDEKIP